MTEAINRGGFGPGEKLPSERDLVQTCVSRVSVREAIRALEALGVGRRSQRLDRLTVD